MMNWKEERKAEASESLIYTSSLCNLEQKKKNSVSSLEKVGKLLFAALGYCDIRNGVS